MAEELVQIKDRQIAVEQAAIPTVVRSDDWFAGWNSSDERFILRPHWCTRRFGQAALLGGCLLFVVGLLALKDGLEAMILVIGGLLTLLFGLWLSGPGYNFRRDTGEFLIRHWGWTRRRPLASVLAVQVTVGGWLSPNRGAGPGHRSPVSRVFLYQLNLILNDPEEPRRLLYSSSRLADLVEMGKRLADFLSAPLLLSPRVQEALTRQNGR